MEWLYLFLGTVAALYVLCAVVGYRCGEVEKELNDEGL